MNFFIVFFSICWALTFGIAFYLFVNKVSNNVKNKTNDKNYVIIVSFFLFSICAFFLAITFNHLNTFIFDAIRIKTDYTKVGAYGDLIGGILNPVVAFIGVVAASLAFYAQYKANSQIQYQFLIQQSTDHFYKMLELHKENINEFKIKSHSTRDKILKETHTHGDIDAIIKTVDAESFELTESFTNGRRCFILMLNDMHYCIEECFQAKERLQFILKDEILLKLAYRIFFWGSHSKYLYPPDLTEQDKTECKHIIFELNEKRQYQRSNEAKLIKFKYSTNDNSTNSVSSRFIMLSGHSSRLAHYYRQLYQTAKHIHSTSKYQNEIFLESDKIDFRFKALRAQMTNEEQLLLYYNYRYGFGGKWDYRYDNPLEGSSEFKFLSKYLMLHNIPLYDTMHIKAENPIEHFSDYKIKFPDSDLFEWSSS
jgi:hypothetical protein